MHEGPQYGALLGGRARRCHHWLFWRLLLLLLTGCRCCALQGCRLLGRDKQFPLHMLPLLLLSLLHPSCCVTVTSSARHTTNCEGTRTLVAWGLRKLLHGVALFWLDAKPSCWCCMALCCCCCH